MPFIPFLNRLRQSDADIDGPTAVDPSNGRIYDLSSQPDRLKARKAAGLVYVAPKDQAARDAQSAAVSLGPEGCRIMLPAGYLAVADAEATGNRVAITAESPHNAGRYGVVGRPGPGLDVDAESGIRPLGGHVDVAKIRERLLGTDPASRMAESDAEVDKALGSHTASLLTKELNSMPGVHTGSSDLNDLLEDQTAAAGRDGRQESEFSKKASPFNPDWGALSGRSRQDGKGFGTTAVNAPAAVDPLRKRIYDLSTPSGRRRIPDANGLIYVTPDGKAAGEAQDAVVSFAPEGCRVMLPNGYLAVVAPEAARSKVTLTADSPHNAGEYGVMGRPQPGLVVDGESGITPLDPGTDMSKICDRLLRTDPAGWLIDTGGAAAPSGRNKPSASDLLARDAAAIKGAEAGPDGPDLG